MLSEERWYLLLAGAGSGAISTSTRCWDIPTMGKGFDAPAQIELVLLPPLCISLTAGLPTRQPGRFAAFCLLHWLQRTGQPPVPLPTTHPNTGDAQGCSVSRILRRTRRLMAADRATIEGLETN